jgi:hypothetical protein
VPWLSKHWLPSAVCTLANWILVYVVVFIMAVCCYTPLLNQPRLFGLQFGQSLVEGNRRPLLRAHSTRWESLQLQVRAHGIQPSIGKIRQELEERFSAGRETACMLPCRIG